MRAPVYYTLFYLLGFIRPTAKRTRIGFEQIPEIRPYRIFISAKARFDFMHITKRESRDQQRDAADYR